MKTSPSCCLLITPAPAVQARRLLKEREWDGHNDGTEVLSRARVFEGGQGTPKRAVTPEAAESTANNQFLGVWRREMGNAPAVFATAEQDPLFVNPNRRKEVINTRARSAQQVVPGKEIDRINGNAQIPVVAMGGASVSQTFEGEYSTGESRRGVFRGRVDCWGLHILEGMTHHVLL